MQRCKKIISALCAVCILCSFMPARIMAETDSSDTFQLELPKTPKERVVWSNFDVGVNERYVALLKSDGTISTYSTTSNDAGALSNAYSLNHFEIDFENDEKEVKDENGNTVKIYTNDLVDITVPPSATYIAGFKSNGEAIVTQPLTTITGITSKIGWSDIVDIYAEDKFLVGLKSDGTVVSTDESHNFEDWKNVARISGSTFGSKNVVLGVTEEGKVLTTADVESKTFETFCQTVAEWENIVDIRSCSMTTVGLKSDGTVVYTDCSNDFPYATTTWENIVDIDVWSNSSTGYVVGVTADGKVLMTTTASPFKDSKDVINTVAGWTDIKRVYAGHDYIVAVKNDGSIVQTSKSRDKYLSVLNNESLEKVKVPKIEYKYEDLGEGLGCYAYLSDSYSGTDGNYDYKIYYIETPDIEIKEEGVEPYFVKDLNKNPYNAENPEENLYSADNPIKITKGTTFNVVLVKIDKGDSTKAYPSNILHITAEEKSCQEGGFLPDIVAVKCDDAGNVTDPIEFIEPGVVNPIFDSISFKFAAYFGNKNGNNYEEIENYDIYWKDAAKENDQYVRYNGETKTFNNDIKIATYAKMKNAEAVI